MVVVAIVGVNSMAGGLLSDFIMHPFHVAEKTGGLLQRYLSAYLSQTTCPWMLAC